MPLLEFLRRLFHPVTRYFQQTSTYDELTDFGPVTPFIQNQLVIIYSTISNAISCLAVGYALPLPRELDISVILLGLLGTFAWFFVTPRRKEVRVVCLLTVAAFLLGASMHRMISYCIPSCKRDLAAVLVGIDILFFSFATIANSIEVRRRMYIMSVLLSAIVLLFWFRSWAANLIKPYVIMGFSFFMGYVVAYSQEMVAQIRCGDDNYIQHAFALFIQMPAFILHMITCRFRRRRREDFFHWV